VSKLQVFDSSVIIEMLANNADVITAYKDHPLITIDLAYGEVYYYCLRTSLDIPTFDSFKFEILDHNLLRIKEAMELRYMMRKRKKDFSFVDALLYIVAKHNNAILVTKDLAFKGMPNVDLVS